MPVIASGAPWPLLGLPLGMPSTRTTLSLMASSGLVIALHELIDSPETVGVQAGGCVPIVQNRTRRFTGEPAAFASLRSPELTNGASSSPAPALPRICLRLS